jgi:23S rRNA (uracil1939-C5)-methyltransferase
METRETVDVVRIAPGGEGVAQRASGEVVFIAATAPGDRVEVGDFERVHGVWRAQVLQVLTPGGDRREPPCPLSNRCGGCDFMHLDPAAQRREKLNILQDALTRVGGDPARPEISFFSAGTATGYRARLRLHVDRQGSVGMMSARSHRVVPLERCLTADAPINAALALLTTCDPAGKKRLQFVEQIELRSAPSAPRLVARLFPYKGAKLRPELYQPLFPEGSTVVIAGTPRDDEVIQSLPVSAELSISVPASGFSQTNPAINQQLVAAVVEAARLRSHRSFLDAYAGAGNFSIPLLKAGLLGEAVDSAGASVFAARALARDLGLPFTGFNVGDAAKLMIHWQKLHRQFDYIVLDPPRSGAKSVVELALGLEPRTLALIGCDPVALARDLGTVTARGGRIESLTLFDMFPETHHSETLAIVDCSK